MVNLDDVAKLQPEVLTLLQNSRRKDRLAHAYLFEGARGTGKKEIARFLAATLFCENLLQGAPCGECVSCWRIQNGNHPDLYYIEPDGQSIKKEQIKYLLTEFQKKAVESSGHKVYIIADIEKMTNSAANSLLKFLEEPSEGTVIILLTSLFQQILPTIVSRCQVVSFKELSPSVVSEQLLEAGVPLGQAVLLAHFTNSVHEGVELAKDEGFQQMQGLVVKLLKTLHQPLAAMIVIHEEWMPNFKERQKIDQALELLLFLFRDTLYTRIEKDEIICKEFSDMTRVLATKLTERKIIACISEILQAKRKLAANTNQQLLLEQLVIRIGGWNL